MLVPLDQRGFVSQVLDLLAFFAGVSLGAMYSQAPPYTYHPNILDLLHFLTSLGGNLLWDVFLQALGIFFTVVILRRYFERREGMRWRPARDDFYRRLFPPDWLIGMVPSDVREGWPQGGYRSGYGKAGARLDPAVSKSIRRLRADRLKDAVESLIEDPSPFERFEQNLNTTLRDSAIFLARDPHLIRRLAGFREWISRVTGMLYLCRELRRSGHDPAGGGAVSPFKQTCVQLREWIITANILQVWPVARANEGKSSSHDHPT
jgi:hypothetical protein